MKKRCVTKRDVTHIFHKRQITRVNYIFVSVVIHGDLYLKDYFYIFEPL